MPCESDYVRQEPIALVGIACEYAGGIDSPKSFWDVLSQGIDLGSTVPEGRFDLDSFVAGSIDVQHNEQLVRRGYFLSNKVVEEFDPAFLGISDREAATMDPCQRILLKKFMHLLEDAGYTMDSVRGSQTSVYIGQFSSEHQTTIYRQNLDCRPVSLGFSAGLFNVSAKLAYHYDLHGPNLSLDTACSSSLQAIDLAVQSLRLGKANLAVAGGANLCYTPETFVNAFQCRAVSPDGRSRSFSADGNGYAKGEGVALVLLKRLTDAEKDGDRIYCVIRHIMSNHDGKIGKTSYVVPSPLGQGRLMNQIYNASHTDPKSVFYVECHATGTRVGDPVEANTVGNFFARSSYEPPLLVGSVKTIIGHTEGTAGVSSLIKVALCLHKGYITPNLHFTTINPRIKAKEYNMHVVTHLTPLPPLDNGPLFIGINSFGLGGNNCHAIVYPYTSHFTKENCAPIRSLNNNNGESISTPSSCTKSSDSIQATFPLPKFNQYFIFILSAKSKASLQLQAKAVLEWLRKLLATHDIINNHSLNFLAALSRKLLLKRTITFVHRVSFVVNSLEQLQNELECFLSSTVSNNYVIFQRKENSSRSICFVFGGQGPQWWAMGRQLYELEPAFRTWIDRIDSEFRSLTTDWRLIDELFRPSNETESHINETNIAQPAIFAIQVALAALWVSWGILPSVIVGHSMGEVAAVFVAGRLTLREAVTVVYHRARLQHLNTRKNGRMLALNLSQEKARDLIQGVEDRVDIAAVNSARSITLSGDTDVLEQINDVVLVRYPKVTRTWLRVENAFHSHQMTRHNIKECLNEALCNIGISPVQEEDMFNIDCSRAQLYSTVHGARVEQNFNRFDSDYWWQNMRQPVMFYQAVSAILNDNHEKPIQFFIELSPHPVLASALQDIIDSNSCVLASLKRKNDEEQCMFIALCHLLNNTVDWKLWFETRNYFTQTEDNDIREMLWDLPYYTFDNSILWYETKDSVLSRRANRLSHHPLLGNRIWTQPFALWTNTISLSSPELAYLSDHQIENQVLFPATAFIEMAFTAARELTMRSSTAGPTVIVLERVQLLKMLLMKVDESIEIHTIILVPLHDFYIYSRTCQREDYLRKGGIASNDIVTSYDNKQILQEYEAREWKLHMHGVLNLKVDMTHELCSLKDMEQRYEQLSTEATWSFENEIGRRQLYKLFESRGYQYGPNFQCIQAVRGSRSEACAELCLKNATNNYSFYPPLLDGCLQTSLMLSPIDQVFVPVYIDKLILPVISSNIEEGNVNFRTFCSFRPVVCSRISANESFSIDVWAWTEGTNSKSLICFNGVTIRNISGYFNAHRLKESVLDKFQNVAQFPNSQIDRGDLQQLFNEFCFESIWINDKTTANNERLNVVLPTPSDLFAIELVTEDSTSQMACSIIKHGCSKLEQTIIKSYHEINRWVAHNSLVTFKELIGSDHIERNIVHLHVIPTHHKLTDRLLELINDYPSFDQINRFSLQLQYVYLVQAYPELVAILSLIRSCGKYYKQFLSGQQDPLQMLFLPKFEKYLHEIYSLYTKLCSEVSFQALLQHLQKNVPISLKVLELGGGTGGSTIHILDLLLNFANATNTPIEYTFTDISPSFFAVAHARFSALLEEKNSRALLSLSYHVLNLNDVPTTQIESFDVIFAANVVHVTKNIVRSLQHIRQLLSPNGLVVLVEICKPLPYLDFFLGLLPQWWLSEQIDDSIREGEVRAMVSLAIWEKAFKLAGGYTHYDASCSESGVASIIAKKTGDPDQLSLLPERKQRVWIIFCDENYQMGTNIASLLEQAYNEKNIRLIFSDCNKSVKYDHIIIRVQNLSADIRTLLTELSNQFSEIKILFAWPLDLQMSSDVEEDASNFFQLQEQFCFALVEIVRACQLLRADIQRPCLIVLTSNAQPNTKNQSHNFLQAPFIGIGRTLVNEYGHNRVKLVDVHIKKEVSLLMLEQLVSEIILKETSFDNEIALIETQDDKIERNVLRYDLITSKAQKIPNSTQQFCHIQPDKDCDSHPFILQCSSSHFLTDITWVPLERRGLEPLSPTQVEIQVHCVGLNFRDLLQLQGLCPHTHSFPFNYSPTYDSVGLEYSGIIIRLGSEAEKSYDVGDRVVGVALAEGAFRSHIIVDCAAILKAPSHYSMEQLATIPVAFLTVIASLKDRVHLHSKQTCLIHSATGGVGLAAIQYCRLVGARIIATAGTVEKRKFLREQIGLEHVFDSRSLSFVNDVRQVAPTGVDVIINSLSGILMQQSMTLLAPNGHFIELGKRDIYTNASLSMFKFRQGCSWHVIDLMSSFEHDPDMGRDLLSFLGDLLERRSLTCIEPMHVFEANQIVDAFTTFKLASHIGKFVIRLTMSQQPLTLVQPNNNIIAKYQPNQPNMRMFSDELCRHGSVLITGGLGSIGLAITKWMIEKYNVRHIVLLARQNAGEIDKNSVRGQKLSEVLRIAEIYAASIQVVKADVADYDQVHRVVTDINKSEYHLRGIIHAALVIHDSLISNMTEEILIKVLRPRVHGAWNLHRVSSQQKLDFFILLSSARNHGIDVGGANYNASNQFFDSLAYWRHNILGLSALSISLPGVLGTSQLEKFEDDMARLRSPYGTLSSEIIFELIEYLHLEQHSRYSSLVTPIILPVDWTSYKNNLNYIKVARIRDLVYKQTIHKLEERQNIDEKSQIGADSTHAKLTDTLHQAIAKIFGSENVDRIDRKKRLCEQGLDSLMAVSLHNWLNSNYSIFIPVIDIAENLSIDDIIDRINTELTNPSRQKPETPSPLQMNEMMKKLVSQTENITDQSSLNESPASGNYTGTSLIVSFSTLSAAIGRPILFCVLNIMEDSEEDNRLFAALLASKLKHISQVCIILRQPEDDHNQLDLIEEYIVQMRRIQPRGPYHLMGYKTGGTLICDIYSKFAIYQDARVQTLVLLDPSQSSASNGLDVSTENQNQTMNQVIINQIQNKSNDQNALYLSTQLIDTEVKLVHSSRDGDDIEQTEKLNQIVNQIDSFF